MSVFELSIYSPIIAKTWQEPLEAVVYNAGKYLP